jgi:hypothetical protein
MHVVIVGTGKVIYHNLIFGSLEAAKNYLRMRESKLKFREFTPDPKHVGFKKILCAWSEPAFGRKYFFLSLELHHSAKEQTTEDEHS